MFIDNMFFHKGGGFEELHAIFATELGIIFLLKVRLGSFL